MNRADEGGAAAGRRPASVRRSSTRGAACSNGHQDARSDQPDPRCSICCHAKSLEAPMESDANSGWLSDVGASHGASPPHFSVKAG